MPISRYKLLDSFYLFGLLFCLLGCLSFPQPQQQARAPQKTVDIKQGLYLSWMWQLTSPTDLRYKRLILVNEKTEQSYAIIFDAQTGSKLLVLEPGTYRFQALIDDRFHPLSLRHIFPHRFHVNSGQISIIGSFEFIEQVERSSMQIRQTAYFPHDNLQELQAYALVSGYSLEPMSLDLLTSYSQSHCQGIHCPESPFYPCFLQEYSRHPVTYGGVTAHLRWTTGKYLVHFVTTSEGHAFSGQLFHCISETAGQIPQKFYGDEIQMRL